MCTFTEEGLVGGDEVDAGVDDDAAEHHESSEAALVEGKIREPEREEEADERDRAILDPCRYIHPSGLMRQPQIMIMDSCNEMFRQIT